MGHEKRMKRKIKYALKYLTRYVLVKQHWIYTAFTLTIIIVGEKLIGNTTNGGTSKLSSAIKNNQHQLNGMHRPI